MGGPVGGVGQIRVGGAVLGGDVDSGSLYGGHGCAASLRGLGQGPVRVTGRITGIVTRRFPGHFAHPSQAVQP
ncbi:hypothetical protein GCM10010255_64470 [Streptomyces coeruleofuscus]|uniref:Uncharacterized protein n=1 Tax=Streptomyces coeruleofuscus TaxID=66879 RepID=A0ABN3IZ56_9ACTN